uniref:Asteroid domain-containing protein n=1 Tax=Schistosoma haematobium TaxID=6185 RepID=A0A095ANR4_SCHHA
MKRNYQRMQTCRQLLNSIKHNQLSSTHSLYNVQLLPPLTIITFIQILNQLNIHYITCDSEADQNVMNLGIYFKCPIISNDSDFYITIPNHNHNDNPMNDDDDNVSFLPLSLISFKPIININQCYSCQKYNQLCMYLKCQKFLINGPGLKNLSINQRSLLASLLGNDYISSNQFIHKLPISFNDKTILLHHNTMTKQIKLKRRKLIILQLINWLLQFNDNNNHNNTNLDKPIQCLLNKYPKLERNQLYHQLMYSIHTYHIHSNLFYLHFNNDLKLFKWIPTFQYLNLDYHFMELHNDWLISIVLINVLNYKSQSIPLYTTTNTTSNIDDITQCPISLTFGAICICTYLLTIHSNHHLSFYKLLNKHYYKCANYFLKHIKSLINNKKNVNKKQLNKLNINYVHRYGQLQIIYITLYTLIHLLDTIVTINQKNQLKTCLNFLSIYFMFPSGYLFHNICHCISFIPSNGNNNNNNNDNSNERYHYVRNVIIKELLNYNHHTNQYLNDAFNLFDQYLHMCNSNPFNHVLNKSLKKFNFINYSKSLKENVIKQDLLTIATTTTLPPPPTTTNKPIQMKMKKIKRKCKPSKNNNNKQCKQLSYAEIEEKVRKLMLENGLLD